MSENALPRRMTIPAMPPSRTKRFEPSPTTSTGIAASRPARKERQIRLVGGRKQHLRRTAGAEPGQRRRRRVRFERAAKRRHRGAQDPGRCRRTGAPTRSRMHAFLFASPRLRGEGRRRRQACAAGEGEGASPEEAPRRRRAPLSAPPPHPRFAWLRRFGRRPNPLPASGERRWRAVRTHHAAFSPSASSSPGSA